MNGATDLFAMGQGDRDGETFHRPRDRKRLDTAMKRITEVMSDRKWHSLKDLAKKGECSETCASARVRDLRKPKFGGWKVDSMHCTDGLWAYRWTGEKA